MVELGYRLNQATWGRGYATDGSRALIQRVHGPEGRAGHGEHHGRQHPFPSRHGEVGPVPRLDLHRRLAGSDRGFRTRRSRVRTHPG
ncbi:hypothetical protein ACIBSW_24795 [Actinoplanes sp. NPDC049668]|uniref:hypothetical protein n=1 Tax=unclassified Actinoplanes TaxID=2626549 RepID=UPI0033ABD588